MAQGGVGGSMCETRFALVGITKPGSISPTPPSRQGHRFRSRGIPGSVKTFPKRTSRQFFRTFGNQNPMIPKACRSQNSTIWANSTTKPDFAEFSHNQDPNRSNSWPVYGVRCTNLLHRSFHRRHSFASSCWLNILIQSEQVPRVITVL